MTVIKFKSGFCFFFSLWVITSWDKFPVEIVWVENQSKINPNQPWLRWNKSLAKKALFKDSDWCIYKRGDFLPTEEKAKLNIFGRSFHPCFPYQRLSLLIIFLYKPSPYLCVLKSIKLSLIILNFCDNRNFWLLNWWSFSKAVKTAFFNIFPGKYK